MASILLDLVNYVDEDGSFDGSILHDWTRGLDVTFDVPQPEVFPGAVLLTLQVEFTGPREDLAALIGRYEEDPGLRPDLVTAIKD